MYIRNHYQILLQMARERIRTTTKASWSTTDLTRAMQAVQDGTSKRKAAKQFGIAVTTLHERLRSGSKAEISSPKMGRKPVFSASEKSLMAENIKMLSKLYYVLTPLKLRFAACECAVQHISPLNFNTEKKCAGRPSRLCDR